MKITNFFNSLIFCIFLISPIASAEEVKYKIGVSIPLTGPLIEYGNALKNGIELSLAELNIKEQNLELDYQDNAYESQSSISTLQKFHANQVDAIFSFGEVPLNATSQSIKNFKIPTVAISLDFMPAINNSFIFILNNDPKSATKQLFDVFRKNNLKKIGIIKVEDPYINSMITGLENNLAKDEKLEIIFTAQPDSMDLKDAALKVKQKAKIDVLAVYLYPGQISNFYKNLKILNIKIPTFGTDIFESPAEIQAAGSAMNGAFYPNFKMPIGFAEKYLAKYKNNSQISYAYLGYLWAKITSSVLNNKNKLTNIDIISAYKNANAKELGLKFEISKTSQGVYFYNLPIIIREIHQQSFRDYQG